MEEFSQTEVLESRKKYPVPEIAMMQSLALRSASVRPSSDAIGDTR
jgi:hypothetical protein